MPDSQFFSADNPYGFAYQFGQFGITMGQALSFNDCHRRCYDYIHDDIKTKALENEIFKVISVSDFISVPNLGGTVISIFLF